MSAFLEELEQRGLVHQMTASGLGEALEKGPLTGYIGFDPTAVSLHVGSLLPATMLARLQRAGHRPIAVVGGATGMVGDPGGRTSERQLLDEETLRRNVAGLRGQLERFIDFAPSAPGGGALLVDNLDWLGQVDLIGFLRDVGKHFSVNAMIQRESVKMRLEQREQGISYTEFSYMLLQAYDFLELYQREGCVLQMGGSDQWGNMVSGCDLIRRKHGFEAHALTWPLLTKADGSKFGKSQSGNVWLDPELTTAFEFYQYWLNTADEEVVARLKQFTFLTLEAIAELEAEVQETPWKRAAQRALAEQMTEMVHGAAALRRAERCTAVLFGKGELTDLDADELRDAFKGSPRTEVTRSRLASGELSLVAALAETELSPSKGQARKTVKSGAISVNHVREADQDRVLGADNLLANRYVVLRRGKKTYHVLEVAE